MERKIDSHFDIIQGRVKVGQINKSVGYRRSVPKIRET
jgi:hypothetical protein